MECRDPGTRPVRIGQEDNVGLLGAGDYRVVFEASPDAMLVVDADGVIRDLNPQAHLLFGWSRDEMEGFTVERLIPAEVREQHQKHRRRYGEAPRPRPMGQGMELLALNKDGATIPVEISLSPSTLATGQDLVICTIRNITAWKRMQRVSRLVMQAAENERKHLSRELHDEFLQYLVALKIRVKLLAEEPDKEERGRSRARIADEILDTIRAVKRMIRGLLPPELEDHRLSSALRSAFHDVHEVFGFTVHAHLEPVEDRLNSHSLLALYRIVQEAVANAVRHATVMEATVTLKSDGNQVVAEIRDEGCGFEFPDSYDPPPGDAHLGLVGMRERATLVGGSLTIQSSPGKGTTVRAVMPFSDDDRPAAVVTDQW